jgi:hypothetical protein
MRSTRAKKTTASVETIETQINSNDPPKSQEDSVSEHDAEDELMLDTDVTLPKGKFLPVNLILATLSQLI